MKTKVLSSMMVLMLMVGAILFAAPPSVIAQQQQQITTAPNTTSTTTLVPEQPPLTSQEREQRDRIENTTVAITQNLEHGEKQVNGIVYTPRWSNPVWVEPDSLSVLFAYCLPGEFADSGQYILGSPDLSVLESYSIAFTNDITGWLMVMHNENQTNRLAATVGAICTSDADEHETRVITPQQQTVIKNIVQQFITIRNIQITNINQVINIINNVIINQTDGIAPPPIPPPPTNVTTLTVEASWEAIRGPPDAGNVSDTFSFTAEAQGGREPYTFHWDFGDGQQATGQNVTHTYEDPGGEPVYNATVTVTDAAGQTASDTTEVHLVGPGGRYPLTVAASWDSTNGDTAPATYSLEAEAFGGSSGGRDVGYTFHWDFGDGQESTSHRCCEYHTYEDPGNYTATVTVTDGIGQTASDSVSFSVSPLGEIQPLSVEANVNPIDGDTAPATYSFEAQAFGGFIPDGQDYTFHWDFGDGQESTPPDGSTLHTYEDPSSYTATVTATDFIGNTASDSVSIEVVPPPTTTEEEVEEEDETPTPEQPSPPTPSTITNDIATETTAESSPSPTTTATEGQNNTTITNKIS
jgi:PKD repeat protein